MLTQINHLFYPKGAMRDNQFAGNIEPLNEDRIPVQDPEADKSSPA
jgi:hypothetical protein